MTWSNGPKLWHDMLTDIGGTACVAGGAVRDYLSGWKVKDIDIFAASNSKFRAGDNPNWKLLTPKEQVARKDKANEYTNDVERMFYLRYHQYDVQVILLGYEDWKSIDRWDTYVKNRFDAGVCRVSYSLKNDIQVDAEYTRDIIDRTYTILHKRTLAASETRAQRFITKHPGWAIKKAWLGKDDPKPHPNLLIKPVHYARVFHGRLGHIVQTACGREGFVYELDHTITKSVVTCETCKKVEGLIF